MNRGSPLDCLTDFDKTLSDLGGDFSRAFVALMRTTNRLERFDREIRCKQRDGGMLEADTAAKCSDI